MRRVLRILVNTATSISLLLCSLTLLAWLSGRSEMVWLGRSGYYAVEVGWHDGRIFAGDQSVVITPPSQYLRWTFHHAEAWRNDDGWSGAPGIFRWDFKPQQRSWFVLQPREVSAPCWMVVLITGVLPLTKLPRFIRWFSRDELAGHCPKCGYDLRATPNQCPECGATPGVTK